MNIFKSNNFDKLNNHTVLDILSDLAINEPAREALTYLNPKSNAVKDDYLRISYQKLDEDARALATVLQNLGKPGDRALLFYEPSYEYIKAFFACIYAGIIAVPVYMPRQANIEKELERLFAIIKNANINLFLSLSANKSMVDLIQAKCDTMNNCRLVYTDTILAVNAHSWIRPDLKKQPIAFLQYTSGSTNNPKGVIITFENLIANIKAIYLSFSMHQNCRGVIWLPPYHDMGLIGGILSPILTGFPVTLMSPISFMQDPLIWLKTISKYSEVISGGPNFAYELCVSRMQKRLCDDLNLSGWKIAFCGAEYINPQTIDKFVRTFVPYGFNPKAFHACYGLAESTLMVTGSMLSPTKSQLVNTFEKSALEQNKAVLAIDNAKSIVNCGSIIQDHHIKIVDPIKKTSLASNMVGEICVSGPSIASGYWNDSETTVATFIDQWLHTGDLGFLHEGQLHIVGRIKDLIILRGKNYYPADIENSIMSVNQDLQNYPATVFSVLKNDTEELVVIQEVPKSKFDIDLQTISMLISKTISEKHGIAANSILFVKAGTIPKTSSGKIRRNACKLAYVSGKIEALVNQRVEQQTNNKDILSYIQQTLGKILNNTNSVIRAEDRLTELGVDSLKLMELKYSFDQDLEIQFDLNVLLDNPSIQEITECLIKAEKNNNTHSKLAPTIDNKTSATHAQLALIFLHKMDPVSDAHSISRAIKIKGFINIELFVKALRSMLMRHQSLLSTFSIINDEIFQCINSTIPEQMLQILDFRNFSTLQISEYLQSESSISFELINGSLFRLRLLLLESNEYILLVCAHHIIIDFWSFAILFSDLWKFYESYIDENISHMSLAVSATTIAQYSHSYQEYCSSNTFENDWQYWKGVLQPPLPQLKIVNVNFVSYKARIAADLYRFKLKPLLLNKVQSFSQRNGISIYTTLLSSFQCMLYLLSNTDDIIVGSPMANRGWAGAANFVGYCVNVLPLRAKFSHDLNFISFIQQNAKVIIDALRHQSFPFSLMIERLNPDRKTDLRPLLNVIFIYQQNQISEDKELSSFALDSEQHPIQFHGLDMELSNLSRKNSQFELIFSITATKEGFCCNIEYDKNLFNQKLITCIASDFENILEYLLDSPTTPLLQAKTSTGLQAVQLYNEATVNDQNTDSIRVNKITIPEDIELKVLEAWKRVLLKDNTGIHDNFFEMGGSSLLSIKLSNELSTILNFEVDIASVFEHQTIAEFVNHIRNYDTEKNETQTIQPLPRIPYQL